METDVEFGKMEHASDLSPSVTAATQEIPLSENPSRSHLEASPDTTSASSSRIGKLLKPLHTFASAVRGWEFNPPAHVALPRNVETVYVREPVVAVKEVSRRRSSELKAETESLLSVHDEENVPLPTSASCVTSREEEHELILEAMRKKMICPNFAVLERSSTVLSPMVKEKDKSRIAAPPTGHMRLLPAGNLDHVIDQLDAACREKSQPFADCENLVEKLSDVQKRQVALHFANLEMVLAKSVGPQTDENGHEFRENLNALHDMMDELSRSVLLIQQIDPRDSGEGLPRRKSLDLPDLQALHTKLFQNQPDVAKDLQAFSTARFPAAVSTTVNLDTSVPIVASRQLLNRSPDVAQLVPDKRKGLSSASGSLSEPPKYPPPPAPT